MGGGGGGGGGAKCRCIIALKNYLHSWHLAANNQLGQLAICSITDFTMLGGAEASPMSLLRGGGGGAQDPPAPLKDNLYILNWLMTGFL